MEVNPYMIGPEKTVREAISAVNEHGRKAILVTDESRRLLGLFSDGDMRRYILQNGDLNAPVSEAMNRSPIVFHDLAEVEESKKRTRMVIYPIVDNERRLTDVAFWNETDAPIPRQVSLAPYPVVIMAGGKGSRLYPYTRILPKPLIPIGEYTISERIIHSFTKYASTDFKFILNYKSSIIKAYFNDLEKDYAVEYYDEKEYLGTGGGLTLLKGRIADTCFVTNCDILVEEDYTCILKHHREQGNLITFVCAMKNVTIPYGVITVDDAGNIDTISEKPSYSFLTNTGLYVVEPSVIESLVDGEFIHMPDIARRLMDRGGKVGIYPVSERAWLDMGQFKEMENMFRSLGGDS
jgi:dTDP-glucose pyrophosphorylase